MSIATRYSSSTTKTRFSAIGDVGVMICAPAFTLRREAALSSTASSSRQACIEDRRAATQANELETEFGGAQNQAVYRRTSSITFQLTPKCEYSTGKSEKFWYAPPVERGAPRFSSRQFPRWWT